MSLEKILMDEWKRQQNTLSMIASESVPWKSVQNICANILNRKYAEGYPSNRYYSGCENADKAEALAIQNAKKLFQVNNANVQPLSGSNANLATFFAMLNPGDTVMGMNLKSGGHLTHGSKISFSGKWFKGVYYQVEENGVIDYGKVYDIAHQSKPRLIIAGVSSYPRALDYKKFREIANSVGAYLLADIAHVAGLIAGEQYPNPAEYADIITSTTHKTLRGPRGGLILSNNDEIAQKIDKAVFPGTQGGTDMSAVAAKAACFAENYQEYASNLILNTHSLAKGIYKHHKSFVGNYDGQFTDTHMVLLDMKGPAKKYEDLLYEVGIACNRNCIPHDFGSPLNPSGIRLGSTVITNRGFSAHDAEALGVHIGLLLEDSTNKLRVIEFVKSMCSKYPLPH